MDEGDQPRVRENYAGHLRRFEAAARRAERDSALAPVITPLGHIGADVSEHEIEVLQLVAYGLSNREIGEFLFMGNETVKWHLTRLFDKLEADNRGHAVAVAFRRGLIT